jgi:hypothetical protein
MARTVVIEHTEEDNPRLTELAAQAKSLADPPDP